MHYQSIQLKEIYTFAYDIRPKLYDALEQSGFEMFDRLQKAVSIEGELVDIVKHRITIDG